MNKYVRFLIVFMVVVVTFALTWREDSQNCPDGQCQEGARVGDSFSTFGSVTPTPPVVVEKIASPENTISMRNLVLVEFFAGY